MDAPTHTGTHIGKLGQGKHTLGQGKHTLGQGKHPGTHIDIIVRQGKLYIELGYTWAN